MILETSQKSAHKKDSYSPWGIRNPYNRFFVHLFSLSFIAEEVRNRDVFHIYVRAIGSTLLLRSLTLLRSTACPHDGSLPAALHGTHRGLSACDDTRAAGTIAGGLSSAGRGAP